MAIKRYVKRVTPVEQLTLQQAFKIFINEKKTAKRSEETIDSYTRSYNRFCEFVNADTQCREFEADVITQWTEALTETGIRTASINHYLRDIRALCKWCQDSTRGYMPPFSIHTVVEQETLPKTYTDAEVQALLKKPKPNDDFLEWRMWAIVTFIIGTGARAGTVAALKMEDIDFKTQRITYAHTKNKRAQIVVMSSQLKKALSEYISIWRANAETQNYVFPNVGEKQLVTNAMRHSFETYANNRGVYKTTLHGLRHTFAKLWVINGGSMLGLQKMLGHSTLDMTKHYIDLYADDIADGFDDVNPLDVMRQSSNREKKVIRAE